MPFRSLLSTLEEIHLQTRHRTWPTGDAWRIAVLALPCDAMHLRHFLDAAETFHPGSSVCVLATRPIAAFDVGGAAREFAGLREVTFQLCSTLDPGATFDLVVLLHPLPYHDPIYFTELRMIRPWLGQIPAKRRWILQRNMELWDGSWRSRMLRRAIQPALNWLRRRAEVEDNRALDSVVTPALDAAKLWNAPQACAHSEASKLFTSPRQTWFCPACGMGFTPPELAPLAAQAPETYGPGYARYHLYTGRREWSRFVAESCARVQGYLETMNFDFTPRVQTPKVLDLGCGNGRFAKLWLDRGWSYLGVDPSEENVASARDSAPERAEFLCGDLESNELKRRGPYDVIFLSHVLEHVPDPVGFLRALKQSTRPKGLIYVEVPEAFHYTWNMRHRGYANVEHLWDFTPAMLRATLESAGWKVQATTQELDPAASPIQAALGTNANVESGKSAVAANP